MLTYIDINAKVRGAEQYVDLKNEGSKIEENLQLFSWNIKEDCEKGIFAFQIDLT